MTLSYCSLNFSSLLSSASSSLTSTSLISPYKESSSLEKLLLKVTITRILMLSYIFSVFIFFSLSSSISFMLVNFSGLYFNLNCYSDFSSRSPFYLAETRLWSSWSFLMALEFLISWLISFFSWTIPLTIPPTLMSFYSAPFAAIFFSWRKYKVYKFLVTSPETFIKRLVEM